MGENMAEDIKTSVENFNTDAQTAEEVVNGNESGKVVARLGREYPTLPAAIEEIMKASGYFDSYATLAEANAKVAEIPLNRLVRVLDATDGGDYYKASADATSLTKSAYDPLTQSKTYTDSKFNVIQPLINSINNISGFYISATNGNIATSSGAILNVFPVEGGRTYIVKAGSFATSTFAIATKDNNTVAAGATQGKVTLVDTEDPTIKKFTVPANAKYAFINLKVSSLDITSGTMINAGNKIVDKPTIFSISGATIVNEDALTKNDLTSVNPLYEPANDVTGFYVQTTTGALAANANYIINIFPVESGKTYAVKSSSYASGSFAISTKDNNNIIAGATQGKVVLNDTSDPEVKTFTVPVGAKYAFINVKIGTFDIRSGLKINLGTSIIDASGVTSIKGEKLIDTEARQRIENIGEIASNPSPIKGKKWAAIGDSITANSTRTDHPYHYYVAQAVGGMTVYNYGSSGTGYFDRLHVASTISQNDIDILTVFLGTNDWNKAAKPLGSLLDTTDATVSGCINILISELMAAFPTKTIALFTPLPRRTNWGSSATPNEDGYTLKQLAEMIKAYANHYSLPCLDLYNSSSLPVWIPAADTYYFTAPGGTNPDGLHPNDAGHQVLARKIQKFLESI